MQTYKQLKNWLNYLLISFFTLYLAILIPIYTKHYGLQNFLWLSDIGLFLTYLGLLIQSPLLISMVVIGVLPLEIFWNVDFFGQLIFNLNISDLADYMFDPSYPVYLRGLSLFHVVLPIVCIVCLVNWGYDKRAFKYFTLLYWVDLLMIYMFADPRGESINWVFEPQKYHWEWVNPTIWVLILALVFPAFIFWPVHLVVQRIFKDATQKI